MAMLASKSLVRQIGSLFDGHSVAGLSDRQLLNRFTSHQGALAEAAFAALVVRHGPMVLGLCNQLLGDRHDAEDAFQAVFLVLAQKARSIRDPDLLGNWIYGVAIRTSRCAKIHLARRRRNEEAGSMLRDCASMAVPSAEQVFLAREHADLLHDEIERLPRAFRLPVVLCYLEGLTVHEAARRLCCSHGTIRSRMARAREKLRRALSRRGVVLPAAALAAALEARSASASVSSCLCEVTTRASFRFAAGQPTASVATAVAREVLSSMLAHQVKLIALTVLCAGVIAAGTGYVNRAQSIQAEQAPKLPARTPPFIARTDVKDQEPTRPAPSAGPTDHGRMTISGRVLDPDGKPAAGAQLDIVGRPRTPWVVDNERVNPHLLLGGATTNGDGGFELDTPRTASTRFFEVYVLAAAPGFGLGWAELNPDAAKPTAEIRLEAEQIVRGKLVDLNGQPAAGVELRVGSVGRPKTLGSYDGVSLWNDRLEGLRAWPRSVTTDQEGRFKLAGIGRELTVSLEFRDPRFARQAVRIQTEAKDAPMEATMVLQPPTIIEGRVLAADTGQPMPRAVIAVAASRGQLGGMSNDRFLADDRGRFIANPSPGDYFRLSAHPPDGQPYLVPELEFAWAKGAVKKSIDIKLPRGVLIRGKVTEGATGRPLPGSSVQYIPNRNKVDALSGFQAVVASKEDGSYQIVVAPGKGYLFVYGPTADYVLKMIGERMVSSGQPGGGRNYAHEIIPYEVKAGEPAHEINSSLRAGMTVKGRLVGPNGQTVDKAEIIATLHFNYFHLNWRGDITVHARDGAFELHGLDPEKPTRVSFLDSDHQWGTTLELSGKQSGQDVTIQLLPCGQARARFVGPSGEPVAKHGPHLELIATPGPPRLTRDKPQQAELAADAVFIANVDRKHYWNGRFTDAEGRITLPDLIPGASYRIIDFSTVNDDKGVQIRKDFTVKPGETLELGDILIEKPSR
jgi:RNA polymerase sigma factor (sigma-70 family)